MAGIFGGGSSSPPPPPPPPPKVPDVQKETAKDRAQAKQISEKDRRRRAGLAKSEDTVLTTGLGLGKTAMDARRSTTRTVLGR